jgi:1,2-dihydroxy-3-keto-5-methylthiopentene dioxygenase
MTRINPKLTTHVLPQGDQRLAHDSGRDVDPTYLKTLGIHHQSFPNTTDLTGINALATARDYKNRDEIEISPTKLPNYEEKVKNFFHEHLHEDEEIRYILDGAGYFDVRSEGDDWVRIRLEKGDLMIMPAGIYHRFTTDEKDVSFPVPTTRPTFLASPRLGKVRGSCTGGLIFTDAAFPADIVHKGDAPLQGGSQVDSSPAW